jgi:hypothetical protein
VDRVLIDKTGTLTLGRPVPDAGALDALTPEEAGWPWPSPATAAIRCRWAWPKPWPRAG